ncbi:integrase_H2C2 domain-containing protein [Nephila pilipes]|uniref:RNA-directed DNA polymerase n=1 Tax=Nephila pilipes TaxID=299642 RepID=A0A8X6U0C0_NEPPI|nr:integrase_H2C2 domain-containing protein [Nephila pilipes]
MITKDKDVTAEMDKGSMVADSFRSQQECSAELALAWEYAKEGKANYYEVDGYLFHRDKILGESIGQLVVLECRWTDVLRLVHTSVFSSHMGPKKTLEGIKYSFFCKGLMTHVKKFCESCRECQLIRLVRINYKSSITPVKSNVTQKNWASIEKDTWAVLYGLNNFDKWIYSAKVEITSDHTPLKYLNQATPKSHKPTRWTLAFTEMESFHHPQTRCAA